MEIREYIKLTPNTRSNLSTIQEDNFHMIMGMTTEIGELVDVFKKNLAYGKEIDWINIQEELGDLCWYISEFCNINNFDLRDILANNIKKLQTRYPEKFNADKAINRDLNAERKILEELDR
jgi:NTP pyrophosphatase (non-canonical NTP hydrolase)